MAGTGDDKRTEESSNTKKEISKPYVKSRMLTQADVDAENKRWHDSGIPLDQPLKVEDALRMISRE